MVARLLDEVDLHIGVRPGLSDPLPGAAVHPGPGAVDEGDWDGRGELGEDARQHGSQGPAIVKLHAEESILPSTERKNNRDLSKMIHSNKKIQSYHFRVNNVEGFHKT